MHVCRSVLSCGVGVTKDFKKAFEYSAKACELNDAKECYALAAFYNEGKGVAKDEKQTKENLKKSCELGLKEAAIFSKNKNNKIVALLSPIKQLSFNWSLL